MSSLLFNSLEIRGYRAFRDLRIEKLGRVNLIVGQNNVGKSCLLEALQIYAHRAHPTFLWQLLEAHDEDSRSPKPAFGSVDYDANQVLSIIQNLFYGRPEMTGSVSPIEIGPTDSPAEKLRVSLGFYASSVNEKGLTTLQLLSPDEYDSIEEPLHPRFSVQLGESRKAIYHLEVTSKPLKPEIQPINCIFVGSHGLDKGNISALWDKIALTDLQKEVLQALRILAPGVDDVGIIGDFGTKRERFPIIKVPSMSKPIPIRSLGEGMLRMLAVVLGLVNAEDGLLLIDEFEHGLHYATQVELWQLIFRLARQLNIQVFATSHSWDCITSFQQAAQESEQEEGMLIRLELKKGEASATLSDKQDLAVITREQIEVR